MIYNEIKLEDKTVFTINHYIWLFICITLISSFTYYLIKTKPSLKKVLNVCCVVCVASELIKTFSSIKMIPSADGTMIFPYIEMKHMPFHLCSIQIILIFLARFSSNEKLKTNLLAFMYPTTILGAFLALIMPSIFSTTISINQAFTHPIAYQFFLYHTMLVILGIYIYTSHEIQLEVKHYFSTLIILLVVSFISIYLNSMFASPVYVNGVLQSVEFTTNFFVTYQTPINIALTEIWHWYLYIGIVVVLGIVLIGLMYLPVFKKKRI